MISLLVLYTLSSTAVKAEDIVDPSTAADRYRSLSNIIWSCLTTILLCTWVSLHPNVPKPVNESRLNKRQWCAHKIHAFLKDNLLPFVLLLLGPEWILMWAIRQRLVVEYMTRKRKGLTRRHAFFIIMGGFHKFSRAEIPRSSSFDSLPASSHPLIGPDAEKKPDEKDEDGEPDHPLDRFDVFRLLDDGKLRLPLEAEIDDKSKSDWIAKSFVLLQTLWFVTQCIARKMDHLPLTELEVVTLGYTLLNLVIYVIWWNKPQKVSRPIRVFCGELPDRNHEQTKLKQDMEAGDTFLKVSGPVLGDQDDRIDLRSVRRTPTFYSGNPPEDSGVEGIALLVTAVIGGAFGAIHFIAWSSPFPTHKMLILWRCGSILMTVAPFPTLTWCLAALFRSFLPEDSNSLTVIFKWIIELVGILSSLLSISLVPVVYVAGRVITLMLAFQTLPSLPPEAFQSVQWTNLFPHI